MRPVRAAPRDRKGGRAVADGRAAGQVLDRGARGPQVRGELFWCLTMDREVGVAVATDLVTTFDDRVNELRM